MTDLRKPQAGNAGNDDPAQPSGGFRPWMIVPAIGAAMVLAVFTIGLQDEDGGRTLPSVLMGKPVPEVALPGLGAGAEGLTTAQLKAPGIKIVNFWASWCPPCRAEHPFIKALASDTITVYGINYKDVPDAAQGFLDELGNPYAAIGTDRTGRHAIEWGVYGMPETFVIDGNGNIIYKKVGPVLRDEVAKIQALVASASANKSTESEAD